MSRRTTKPRLVNSYNKPLTALRDVLNRNVGSSLGFMLLRDMWRAEVGSKDERFADWLDYAFELELFTANCYRTFYDRGKDSYAIVHILKEIPSTPWDKLD